MIDPFSVEILPFTLSVFFFTVVMLWTLTTHTSRRVVALLIPLSLVAVATSVVTVSNLLGFPVKSELPEKTEYVAHELSGDVIYVWVMLPHIKMPRAYEIPATNENRKTMDQAAKGKKQGTGRSIVKVSTNEKTKKGVRYVFEEEIESQPTTRNALSK